MSTPVNSLISAIDSHYLAVRTRIKALNPNRLILGVMDAQDWPPMGVQMEALYCLNLGEVPLGKEAYSATIPIVVHTVQWTWMISGTDIQVGIQIRNRGDRYRINYQIEKELLNGIYPGFAEKLNVSVDGSGNLVGVSMDPVEYIVWSPVSFVKKSDKESGLLTGIATTHITDMTDVIT